MYDNGLLKYYREKAYKDGILLGSDLNIQEIEKSDRISLCKVDGARFYTKRPRDPVLHRAFDPEILLSQIYQKAGLSTAIYLSVNTSSGSVIISNDIANDDSVTQASNFLENVVNINDRYNIYFLSPDNKEFDISRYFTLRALAQQTKLRVYDTASYNSDRHDENYYYKLLTTGFGSTQTVGGAVNQTVDNEKPSQTRADDIISIDYELSGLNSFRRMELGEREIEIMNEEGLFYEADFGTGFFSRNDMLQEFRENELFASVIDKKTVAEELGSIDPISVAKDIETTIGYRVEPKYVDFLAKSYEDVAETLMQ